MKRSAAEEVSDEAIEESADGKKPKFEGPEAKTDSTGVRELPFSIAVVCLSNLNRSMEAHQLLAENGFPVKSFGAGSKVRLPGETKETPNVYEFGTPYSDIISDLTHKNENKYLKNGMIPMVERNRSIKPSPERFQDCSTHFQLILTYEKRVYDAVCADLEARDTGESRGTHVINLETKDTHTEAALGAKYSLALVQALSACADWEDEIDGILDSYQDSHEVECLLHTVMFY